MGSDKFVEKMVEKVCNERDILFNLFIIYRKLERIEKNIYDYLYLNKECDKVFISKNDSILPF